MTFPDKGAEYYDYLKAICEDFENSRDGLATLVLRLAGIEDLSRLLQIPESKLDVDNEPADGQVKTWNEALGKPQWNNPAAATDTGEIRMNPGDSKGFVDDKIGYGLVNVDDKITVAQDIINDTEAEQFFFSLAF